MTLSITTSYGSKSYQHEVLKDRPVAYFTSYNSSSSKLIDSSNRDMLSASLAAGASYTKQIPFFALQDDNCTFTINSSNKISIYENGNLYPKSIGSGRFSLSDEHIDFSVEFIFNKNFDTDSNTDFARFGIYNSAYNVGISYDNIGNAIYLNIYSSDNKLVFRSVVYGGMSAASKHVAIVFSKGRPQLYVNSIVGITALDELPEIVFFQPKTLNRLVAEFSCETDNENIEVSNIAFYDYALSQNAIAIHYNALYDIGNYQAFSSKYGSPLLSNNINHDAIVGKNTGQDQSFYLSDIHGLVIDPYIRPLYYPNFYPNGRTQSLLDVDYSSGSAGVSSSVDFRISSDDIQERLLDDGVSISFKGIGTGSYTKETPLISIVNSNVGDFYVSVGSASSTVFLGTGSNTILTAISGPFNKQTLNTVSLKFYEDSVILIYDDATTINYASYTFASYIDLTSAKVDFFNRSYFSSASNSYIYVGNGEIDLNSSYIGSDFNYKFSMSNSIKNRAGNESWDYVHYKRSEANISLPVPSSDYGYIKIDDSSDNIQYALYVDNNEIPLKNDYIINIPSTSSFVNLVADIDAYWGGRSLNPKNSVYIKDIKIYTYPAASFSSGGYRAILEAPNGIINNADNYLNIFRRPNIGFMCVPNGILKISQQNFDNDSIGIVEFLISIPEVIDNNTQYLVYSSSASMQLVPSSGSYTLSFNGMSASVNTVAATSSVTKLIPRHLYFFQASFTNPIPNGSYVYMFSDPSGSSYFKHSFDHLSVFPYTEINRPDRYAQIFGRKNYTISDDDNNYFKIQGGGSASDVYMINTTWQAYVS